MGNYLIYLYTGATSRTCREEQRDESEEFLKLFGATMQYVQGQRTMSGINRKMDRQTDRHVMNVQVIVIVRILEMCSRILTYVYF